jgi:hypothetical protein
LCTVHQAVRQLCYNCATTDWRSLALTGHAVVLGHLTAVAAVSWGGAAFVLLLLLLPLLLLLFQLLLVLLLLVLLLLHLRGQAGGGMPSFPANLLASVSLFSNLPRFFLPDCSAAGWSIPAREAYLLSTTLCLQYKSGRRAIHQAITVQCKSPGGCGAEDLCRPARVLSSWRQGRGGVGVSTLCTADTRPLAPLQERVLGLSREHTTCRYEC